jgi:TPR repeat protein
MRNWALNYGVVFLFYYGLYWLMGLGVRNGDFGGILLLGVSFIGMLGLPALMHVIVHEKMDYDDTGAIWWGYLLLPCCWASLILNGNDYDYHAFRVVLFVICLAFLILGIGIEIAYYVNTKTEKRKHDAELERLLVSKYGETMVARWKSRLIAAKRGDAEAQYLIGDICYHEIADLLSELGRYNEMDEVRLVRAKEWYLSAAEQGLAKAQVATGWMEKDTAKRREWYLTAAAQGDASAMFRIGGLDEMYMHYSSALEWYLKAAAQGYAEAQIAIGSMYFMGKEKRYGTGIEQDYDKAKEWFLKAAEQGNAKAQVRMGSLYETQRDYAKAVKWYTQAAEQGDDDAKRRLEHMDVEELQKQEEKRQEYRRRAARSASWGTGVYCDYCGSDNVKKGRTHECDYLGREYESGANCGGSSCKNGCTSTEYTCNICGKNWETNPDIY